MISFPDTVITPLRARRPNLQSRVLAFEEVERLERGEANRDVSRLSNVKILVALPDRKGAIGSKEFVSENLCEEDIVGACRLSHNRDHQRRRCNIWRKSSKSSFTISSNPCGTNLSFR
jgi:hypothetical protein